MEYPLADEILRRLLQAGNAPVSGEKLARALGVTRAAVWKGVRVLRGQGYPVESLPAQGYRLAGDRARLRPGELAARLGTRVLGHAYRYLEEVDSTSREAERWALGGAPEGALVVAERQQAGRGRLGRSWVGLPGKSLLFSLVLRPSIPTADAPLLTYAASVALVRALSRWIDRAHLEIKWPNDVLVGGRKAAGILLELRAEGQAVDHVVVGVGVNVEGGLEEFPAELRDRVATVAEFAAPAPERLGVLCAFLEEFESGYERFVREGFGPLREEWNAWFRMAGRPVRVQAVSGALEGIAQGLDPSGALLLRSAQGVFPVFAGDVELAAVRS
ncbi:MAG: biotin--[acetyl-CoA-carboxylase] ligase [Deltaproteobacteria bacterium]|nr:biotin--[acetyl-CoA-carboxylase] ligase [Deltaproteobacteria bacterium]